MDLSNIEAIIFDLGGVILDIDIEGTFEKFQKLGIGTGQPGLEEIKTNKIFTQFEIGALNPYQFREEIRKISINQFHDNEFDSVWNSMILSFPVNKINMLEQLKSKYRTFLMSNTNIIHYEYYTKMLSDNFGHDSLESLFEKAYFSHSIGIRKPNKEFFELILAENNLTARTTLFVDDFIENIEAAKTLNINTYHIVNGNSMLDLIETSK